MISEPTRPLRPAEERFVRAYLASGDRATAAQAAAISPRTAGRFLKAPEVRAAIAAAAREALTEATQILAAGASEAATTWRGIVAGRIAADGVRLAACSRLFDHAARLFDLADFEARLAAVEQRQVAAGWKGGN